MVLHNLQLFHAIPSEDRGHYHSYRDRESVHLDDE